MNTDKGNPDSSPTIFVEVPERIMTFIEDRCQDISAWLIQRAPLLWSLLALLPLTLVFIWSLGGFNDDVKHRITTSATTVGCIVAIYQLFRSHHWNRCVKTQDLCDNFLDNEVWSDWEQVRASTSSEEATDGDSERALRRLLSFFENVGILIRNGVVVPEIVYDHFSGVVKIVYEKGKAVIERERAARNNDPRIYENFEQLYWTVTLSAEDLDRKREIFPRFRSAARRARLYGRHLRGNNR